MFYSVPLTIGRTGIWLAFSSLLPGSGSTRKSLFSVNLSFYCSFTHFPGWKPVITLCTSPGRHSCGKELLAHGHQETKMIRPPTSLGSQILPAILAVLGKGHAVRWAFSGDHCPRSTALGNFQRNPGAEAASSAAPDFWASEAVAPCLFAAECHWV